MGAYGVVGDPSGMNALADRLVARASDLRAEVARMKKRWRDAKVESPLMDTAQSILDARWRQLGVNADALDGTAARLRAAATRVSADITAAERRFREAQRRAHEEQIRRQQEAARTQP